MIPVVIFGAGTMGRLAWHCFESETSHYVAAFCVDDTLHNQESFCGLPVIPASQLPHIWAPGSCKLFVALGYQEMNAYRRSVFERYAARGYDFASCISSRALIMNEGNLGINCFVMEGAIIQPFSRLGNNCVCWSGSIVSHESCIGDHCFLAAHSVVGGMANIGEGSFLGMNSTIRDGVHVGKKSLVGAGSLVLEDIPDGGLVSERGSPVAPFSSAQALRFIGI